MHVLKRVVVPNFGGQNQRYQGQPPPVGKVHQKPGLGQESLDVDQAQNRYFFLHPSRNDHVFRKVVQLLKARVPIILGLAAYQLVLIEIIVLIEYTHLESHQLFEALFGAHVKLVESGGRFVQFIICLDFVEVDHFGRPCCIVVIRFILFVFHLRRVVKVLMTLFIFSLVNRLDLSARSAVDFMRRIYALKALIATAAHALRVSCTLGLVVSTYKRLDKLLAAQTTVALALEEVIELGPRVVHVQQVFLVFIL